MADKTPAQITPGTPGRGDAIHASIDALGDLSRSVTPEDVSRLQSAINVYSSSLTYKAGDVVIESGSVYRCNTDINAPEAFNPTKWDKITQNSPWDEDEDANQFKLFNIPLIEMQADGTVTLTMQRTTNPGVTGNSAVIDFRAARSTGGNIVYGSIRNVINDVVAGTVSSEIQFQARQADSLTIFMTVNEGNNDHVRFFRPANIHQTHISFDNHLSPPGGSTTAIYRDSDLIFNVPSGNAHSFRINQVEELNVSATSINAPNASFTEAGSVISPIGKHDIWLDASAAQPVDAGLIQTRIAGAGDNQKSFTYVPFISGSDTFATMKFKLPRNYNNGTITATILWTSEIEGTGTVIWGIAGVALTDLESMATSEGNFGTEVTVTDSQAVINETQDSPRTAAITLAGTPADGDTIFLRVRRLGGTDTFPNDAQLMGAFVEIELDEAVAA